MVPLIPRTRGRGDAQRAGHKYWCNTQRFCTLPAYAPENDAELTARPFWRTESSSFSLPALLCALEINLAHAPRHRRSLSGVSARKPALECTRAFPVPGRMTVNEPNKHEKCTND